MAGRGLRLQLFAAMAVAVPVAGVAAAVIGYHAFARELERAVEARLEMLVAETGRVLDAGIAAGLDLDRPQLLARALYSLGPDLESDETIAVVDTDGRIVASSDAAEIGELLPPPLQERLTGGVEAAPAGPVTGRLVGATTAVRGMGDAGLAAAGGLVVARPVQSLFGAPAGHVVARAAEGALDAPRQAFLAKVGLIGVAILAAGLALAGLAAAFLPWPARRAAARTEALLGELYASIGSGAGIGSDGSEPGRAPPPGLPPALAEALRRFVGTVARRESELARRTQTVDRLDEAA